MALLPMRQLKEETERERRALEAGEKPKSRFASKLQRTAARALAAFFSLMLVLTLLARAADGVTVARVEAERTKTGVLTQRVNVNGSIEPLGDLPLTLPEGILVSSILAKQGQRVQAGDVLMELDGADLANQLTALEEKLRIVNLRLAAAEAGSTDADVESVLAAEQALADAQAEYDRLKEKLEHTGQRSEDDLADVQAEYDQALADYDRAVEKARKRLTEEAQDKVDQAKKELKATQESAQAAIEAAEDSLTSAQDAKKSSNKNYYESVENLRKLKEKLRAAEQELADLIAAGATQAEIDEAQADVDSLNSAIDAADWNMGSYDYGSDLAVSRAKENLVKVQERQAAKVQEAEAEVQKAEDELAKVQAREDLTEESEVVSAQAALDTAEKAIKTAQRSLEDGTYSSEEQLAAAQRAIQTAQRDLDTARRKAEDAAQKALLTDEKARQQAEIERLGYRSEKRTLEQDISGLRAAMADGGKLIAPIDGTVQSILADPGRTQAGAHLAVLSRSDKGFSFEGTLAETEAEDLAAGDKGTVRFTQEGKSREVEGVISAIGAPDDKGQVTVTVTLPDGTYPSGGSASFEVSKRSEQYRQTLPLGALRGEKDNYYVLVLREKQTVMGTEQTVIKLPVTVLDQDSSNAAVEGAFTGTEQVVTTSSKPIEEGDRVRLETAEE